MCTATLWLKNIRIKFGRKKGMKLFEYPINFLRFHESFRTNCYPLSFFLFWKKEEAPVYVTVILLPQSKTSRLNVLIELRLERNLLKKNPNIHYFKMSAPKDFLSSWEKWVYSIKHEVCCSNLSVNYFNRVVAKKNILVLWSVSRITRI